MTARPEVDEVRQSKPTSIENMRMVLKQLQERARPAVAPDYDADALVSKVEALFSSAETKPPIFLPNRLPAGFSVALTGVKDGYTNTSGKTPGSSTPATVSSSPMGLT